MEGTVDLGGSRVRLNACAGVIVLYRKQFGTEYIYDYQDCFTPEGVDLEKYADTGLQLLWCMAKLADPNIPAIVEWLERLGGFDLNYALDMATELWSKSLEDVQPVTDDEGEELTSENLIASITACGMTVADLEHLTLSMVLGALMAASGEGTERPENSYNLLKGF